MFKNKMIPQVFHSVVGGGGMGGDPVLVIQLGIDPQSAQRNLQTEIDKMKSIQKAVDLTLSSDSKQKIQESLNKLNLKTLSVDAKLDIAKTKKNINDQLKNLKLNQVKITGKLDIVETKRKINEQLKGVKLNPVKVKVDPKVEEPKVKPQPKPKPSDNPKPTPKPDTKPTPTPNSPKVKVDSTEFKSLQDVMKKFSDKEYTIKIQRNEIDGTIQQIQVLGKLAHNLKENLTIKPSVDKSGLEGFNTVASKTTNTVKADLTEGLEKAKKKLEELSKSGKVSQGSLEGMKKHLDNLGKKLSDGTLDAKHLDNFNARLKDTQRELTSVPSFMNKIVEAENKLQQALHKGLIDAQQFAKELEKLNHIKLNGSNLDLSNFNNNLKSLTTDTKRMLDLEDAAHRVTMKEKEILTLMERLQRQNPKTFKTDEAKKLEQRMIALLAQYKQIGNGNVKFTNLLDPKNTLKELQRITTEMKHLGAEAQQAGRNSMTLWDSFKVAMSKFPVWMGASTIFYALTNGAKELTRTIIEVDSKMTTLKKVMSPDTNFDNLFTQATEDAKMFGQTLTDVLDAYGEFARQGFKGEELQQLSQVGMVTANVGELSAQDASQFITSTLIQWKKDTSDAMG